MTIKEAIANSIEPAVFLIAGLLFLGSVFLIIDRENERRAACTIAAVEQNYAAVEIMAVCGQ